VDYLVSCNHLVKIVKVYMLPFCGEIKMNILNDNSRVILDCIYRQVFPNLLSYYYCHYYFVIVFTVHLFAFSTISVVNNAVH